MPSWQHDLQLSNWQQQQGPCWNTFVSLCFALFRFLFVLNNLQPNEIPLGTDWLAMVGSLRVWAQCSLARRSKLRRLEPTGMVIIIICIGAIQLDNITSRINPPKPRIQQTLLPSLHKHLPRSGPRKAISLPFWASNANSWMNGRKYGRRRKSS